MTERDIAFEESLSDAWDAHTPGVAEVPLDDRPLWQVGLALAALALVVTGRLAALNIGGDDFYVPRAEANLGYREQVPAPRGVIADRFGNPIAENRAVFSALLNVREFLRRPELQKRTLLVAARTLGLPAEEIWKLVRDRDLERSAEPIVLASDITHAEVVGIREAKLETLRVEDAFSRSYPEGQAFSTLLGYVGLPTKDDLATHENLTGRELIGKSGLERYYDGMLRGEAGMHVTLRDAKGNVLGEQERSEPKIGETLALTIDAEFQKYFYERFLRGLSELGRTSGAGLAIDPRSGEILALVSFPAFDNSVFTTPGKNAERQAILNDPARPLFNRAVGGAYSPASTVKPLVGVAALAEHIITPERTVFSPGYIDIPNPYNPAEPTRFEDWRYQGDVNVTTAIAQSSNVYFYVVGGGGSGIKGLGVNRLRTWWQRFGFGTATGVDMPGEAEGFLPSVEWKEKRERRPWLLGDTYNVSIGQGDLQVTPVQLLAYISAIANGGTLYMPHVNKALEPHVNGTVDAYAGAIKTVQGGMRAAVTNALGTAHTMNDLPFAVSAKTGSAQVKNNREENAFFVGYGPSENPEIAILVLVENSKQGSLNAVPIAEDALRWYYERRLK